MTATDKKQAAIANVDSAEQGIRRQGQDTLLGPNDVTGLGSADAYSGGESTRQLSDAEPRISEEDMQRKELGPRGLPGKRDPATMTPQRAKKTPKDVDPGHTA